MYHNIDVLFGIIGVVMKWCDIMVSAAGIINNDSRCESSMARFQDMTVETGWWTQYVNHW